MPFCPFQFGVFLVRRNSRKKGTLIIMGLLRNLVEPLYSLKLPVRRETVHLEGEVWDTPAREPNTPELPELI